MTSRDEVLSTDKDQLKRHSEDQRHWFDDPTRSTSRRTALVKRRAGGTRDSHKSDREGPEYRDLLHRNSYRERELWQLDRDRELRQLDRDRELEQLDIQITELRKEIQVTRERHRGTPPLMIPERLAQRSC